MADRYPRSIEELTAENLALRDKVAVLEADRSNLQAAFKMKEAEVEVLRRRKPIRVLDPEAKDKFARPARC